MTIEEFVRQVESRTHSRSGFGIYRQAYHKYEVNFLYSSNRNVFLEISGETFTDTLPDKLIQSTVDHIFTCLAMSPEAAEKQIARIY